MLSNMTKTYKVAENIFSIVLPEGSPLCSCLGQYEPFECESDSPLFVLEEVESLPCGDLELIYDQPCPKGETKIRIYRSAEGMVFESSVTEWHPTSMRLLLNPDYSRGQLQVLKPSEALFALNNSLMLQYAFCCASHSTLEVHASVISCNGKGYLFMAPSGTGKSTHSCRWLENIPGSSLLNDDNPIIRVMDDGSVRVFGSPWSGKTPCYKNEDYPVGALVQISRAPFNRAERLGVLDSYALIYGSSSGLKFLPSMCDALHSSFNAIVGTVPCFRMHCLPDADAAKVCYEAVKD